MSIDQEGNKEYILKLIDKLKNGEATEGDLRAIDQWYDTPVSKAKYADGMSSAEKLRAKEKILRNINSQIIREDIPNKANVSYRLLKTLSLAAILLLMFGAGLFYMVPAIRQQPAHPQLAGSGTQHRSDKALLTLANGKQIILTGAKNGMLASQGNITINKRANGQIVYSADKQENGSKQYNTMATMRGGEYHLTLSDGTNVWLNAASSLKYPTSFSGSDRTVELSGEAYFEVAHDPSHPFRVVTKKQTIEVLGTHFNINAYENELSTKTTLLQGAVRVSANGRFKILKPGQQAAVNANEIELTDADPQEAIAWKDGFFEFTDADIETIMRQISRWYDVDVTYEGEITRETFTGRVSKFLSIKQVLALVQSPEVHITYEGRRVMVKN
jgi:ferric-dicitrate binding protein FerR (iron transport regulator)